MTTPSLFEQIGISIQSHEPLVKGGRFIENLDETYLDYQHGLSTIMGFDWAQITVGGNQETVEGWLETGLGRHLEIFNPSQGMIHECFVNMIELTIGPLVVRYGPLLDVINRLEIVYSAIDTSVDPPIMGNRVKTAVGNNVASQTLYGIIQSVKSASGMTDANAIELRDSYLQGHKDPKTTKEASTMGGERPIAILHCLGYGHWLSAYTYLQNAAGGDIAINTKIQNVLTFEPNGFFSADYSRIIANAWQVPQWEDEDRKALSIIKSLVALGDINDNRYIFGIYEGRRAVYQQAPDVIEYLQYVGHHDQWMETIEGTSVQPWDVLPGKWLQFPDFMIGKPQPAILSEDERNLFIEDVTYRAPYDLKVNGDDIGKISRKLAKMGLGGVSS